MNDTLIKILKERSVSVVGEIAELRKRVSCLNNQRKAVMKRFGLGDIPREVYDLTKAELDQQIDELEAEISRLHNNSSNLPSDMKGALLTSCKLGTLWKTGDFQKRQKIQNLAFPKGVIWDREIGEYLTTTENEALRVIRSISSIYKSSEKEKTGKTTSFSGLVDYAERISNHLEDLIELDLFAKELDNTIPEKAH